MLSKSIEGSREQLRIVSGNPGKGAGADASDGKQGAIEAFIGDIVSIHHLREQAALVWAGRLGINAQQWRILMAISLLDRGSGVSAADIAAKVHVGSPFVTTQSRRLVRQGLLLRTHSSRDGRFVTMSLTHKAHQALARLASSRALLDDCVFAGLNAHEFHDVTRKLTGLRQNLVKLRRRQAMRRTDGVASLGQDAGDASA
jgi:MarR family transcriptional regulator, organic hydroperoxide resistance regulator